MSALLPAIRAARLKAAFWFVESKISFACRLNEQQANSSSPGKADQWAERTGVEWIWAPLKLRQGRRVKTHPTCFIFFLTLHWNIKGDDILCESMATNDYREGTVALTSWHKQGNRLEKMAHTHTHVLEHESKFIWLASVCRVRARCKVGDAVWSDSSLAANTLTRRFPYCQMQNKVCHCLCSRPPKCQS